MRIKLLIFFLLFSVYSFGLTRTWVGTTSTAWGTTTNWNEGAVPTSADDVVITAVPLNDIDLNTSARVCKSINFTNFGTRTITFSNTLTVSGNITLINTMVFAGTSALIVNATATLTSNGITVPQPMQFNGGITITLADNWAVKSLSHITGTVTINGNTLTINGSSAGDFSLSNNGCNGTTNITLTGTGTWSGSTTAVCNNNLTINTAGTITLGVSVGYGTNTLTYTAGTVDATTNSSTLFINSACTLTTNGISWYNITMGNSASATVTLGSNLTATNNVSIGVGTQTVTVNSNTFNIGGSLTHAATSTGNFAGTASVVMNGTGTISSLTSTGRISINLEINTAGTITLSGTVNFGGGTFKYTAGTIVLSSSTLSFITSASTITINGTGLTLGAIASSVSLTINGTEGFTMSSFSSTTAGLTHTWQALETYTITGALTLTGTAASNINFVSSSGTDKPIVTLNQGATQDVGHVTATRIDSSLGQTVWDWKGTLTSTVNWNLLAASSMQHASAY